MGMVLGTWQTTSGLYRTGHDTQIDSEERLGIMYRYDNGSVRFARYQNYYVNKYSPVHNMTQRRNRINF